MAKIYKQGAGISLETLAKILLLLGFLIVAALIIGAATGLFDINNADRTVCYVSNALTSSNFLFKSLVPFSCSIEVIDEPADEKQLTVLLKDTWWMFGEGDFDLGNFGHQTFTPFTFKPKTDIPIIQYYSYLQTHKKGNTVSDRSKSDYEYLQKGSPGQTLCFTKDMLEEGKPLQLNAGQMYFINLFDDQNPHDCGDKILISKEPGFSDADLFDDPNFFFCYSPDTQKTLLISALPEELSLVPALAAAPFSAGTSLLLTAAGGSYYFTEDTMTICNIEQTGER